MFSCVRVKRGQRKEEQIRRTNDTITPCSTVRIGGGRVELHTYDTSLYSCIEDARLYEIIGTALC
jgi:hypothetical protein